VFTCLNTRKTWPDGHTDDQTYKAHLCIQTQSILKESMLCGSLINRYNIRGKVNIDSVRSKHKQHALPLRYRTAYVIGLIVK